MSKCTIQEQELEQAGEPRLRPPSDESVTFIFYGVRGKMAGAEERQPSLAATATATAIISFLMGYFFGQGKSIGLFGSSSKTNISAGELDEGNESDSSDAESGDESAELKTFSGNEECKLVLVVRTDLGMVSISILSLELLPRQ